MNVVSAANMWEIERIAIEEYGINSLILMENAALLSAEHIMKTLTVLGTDAVVIMAGNGNNGGDALALARLLYARGIGVNVIYYGNPENASEDNKWNLNILKKIGLDLYFIEKHKEISMDMIAQADVVIDGLLGTGINKAITGVLNEIVVNINKCKAYVISLDIPTGLHSDSGAILGSAVNADETLTFCLGKIGLYAGLGKVYCGKIAILNIGIPSKIIKSITQNEFVLTHKEVIKMLPKREIRTNKGSFGKAYVFAGSDSMPGAALLVAKALYKTGAGLVKIGSTARVTDASTSGIWDVITQKLPQKNGFLCGESYDEIKNDIASADIIVIGPGLGYNKDTEAFFEKIIKNTSCKIVIDADALTILANNMSWFSFLEGRTVITPHPKEMNRLTQTPVTDILCNTVEVARVFAQTHKVVTLLKDTATIVADEDGKIYINTSGTQAMAKAGSVDVLTGIIAGLIAQGTDIYSAACAGCFIHGKAGEIAMEKHGLYGVMASELPDFLPLTMTFMP